MASKYPRSSLKYLLVLDFEATCGNNITKPEIIEFPTLVYDLEQDKVTNTFHEYVRPTIHPRLTPFCTELTGIEQETVDAADSFPDVWTRFQEFMKSNGLLEPETIEKYAFVTCGDWDLKTMLPSQLKLVSSDTGLDASGNLVPPYNRWINVKRPFLKELGLRCNVSMVGMLKRLKLDLEGRHHSGIDDCKNILRIVQKLREEGWAPSLPAVS